jgi:hypothetical protein
VTAQAMAALDRAHEVQRARSAIKRALITGDLSLAEALTAEACWTITVERMLRQLPGWGDARARRVLSTLGIAIRPTSLVGDLTDRQRALLVAAHDREVAKVKAGRARRGGSR